MEVCDMNEYGKEVAKKTESYMGNPDSVDQEIHDIQNADYGVEVRGALAAGVKKSFDKSKVAQEKSEEATDITQNLLNDSFDTSKINANFEQRLDTEIRNLQPEWTGFKDDVTSQLAHMSNNSKGTVNLYQYLEFIPNKNDEPELWDWTLALQSAFNESSHVKLPDQTVRITAPIIFKGYKKIIGSNQTKSKIITSDDINVFYGSVTDENAYVELEEVTLEYKGTDPSTKAAIHLEGSSTSPYTGARYGLFRKVTISNFYDGIYGSNFWATQFDKVRINNIERACVVLGEQVNAVMFRDCIFLRAQHAIIATPAMSGGSIQSTSVHFDNCDIESMSDYAFKLTAIEKFSSKRLHMENSPLVFDVDSVSAFSLKDSRLHGVERLLNQKKTYSSPVFEGEPTIEDNHITVRTDGILGLLHLTNIPKAFLKNNKVYNVGTGKVYWYGNDFNAASLSGFIRQKNVETPAYRFRYTVDQYQFSFDFIEDREKLAKIPYTNLVCVSGGTATSSTEVQLLDTTGTVIYTGTIQAKAYASGEEINMARNIVTGEYYRTVVKQGDTWKIRHTNSTGAETPTFKLVFFRAQMGDFA